MLVSIPSQLTKVGRQGTALAATGSSAVAQAAGSPAAKPADTDALARFSDCGELTEQMRDTAPPT